MPNLTTQGHCVWRPTLPHLFERLAGWLALAGKRNSMRRSILAVTAHAALGSCHFANTLRDSLVWSSDRTTVASVDPSTGAITARAGGRANISVQGLRYGALGTIPITVQ